jgi:general stress protein 26
MDRRQHLYDVTKGFKTAMLVTRAQDGSFHARPMAVAEIKPDADAYFSTSLASPKIAELQENPNVLITFQSSSEFATIQGTATIVRDRAEIDRLWSEAWRIWFPDGKDDPDLCLLKISAESGEYWDTSGLEGIKFMFESLKARIAGRTPEKSEVQNAKIQL